MMQTAPLIAAITLILTQVACGQTAEQTGDGPSQTSSIHFQFTPGIWLTRLGGSAKLGPGSDATVFEVDAHLGLDDLEAVFIGEVTAYWEKRGYWRLSGFDFSTSATSTLPVSGDFGSLALREGDRCRASVDITSLAMEVGIPLFPPTIGEASARAGDGELLQLTPVIGVRYADVTQMIEQQSLGREAVDGQWIALTGGLDMVLRWQPEDGLLIGEAMRIEVGGAIGPALGGDGGIIWQVRAGLSLELTANIDLTLGYRLVELEVEDDDWEFNAGLQGLMLSASIRF